MYELLVKEEDRIRTEVRDKISNEMKEASDSKLERIQKERE